LIKINEIFYSIQGESSAAGVPTVFVRLTGCNLRCAYCDTKYAFYEGKEFSLNEIVDKVKSYKCKSVEITGGEPLLQEESFELMKLLADEGLNVMLETSGSISVKDVDKRVKIIMDLKCPSSGMEKKNLYDNFSYLKEIDEVKFVVGNREDYDWAKLQISTYNLDEKHEVLISPVFGEIEPVKIVNWILEDKLKVRFQLQMHKFIWEPDKRGV
jgi:7-carboxy-7-deazaguanine synthase